MHAPVLVTVAGGFLRPSEVVGDDGGTEVSQEALACQLKTLQAGPDGADAALTLRFRRERGQRHGGISAKVLGLLHPQRYLARMPCVELLVVPPLCRAGGRTGGKPPGFLLPGAFVSPSTFEKIGGASHARWYRSLHVVLPRLEALEAWLQAEGLPILLGSARRKAKRTGGKREGDKRPARPAACDARDSDAATASDPDELDDAEPAAAETASGRQRAAERPGGRPAAKRARRADGAGGDGSVDGGDGSSSSSDGSPPPAAAGCGAGPQPGSGVTSPGRSRSVGEAPLAPSTAHELPRRCDPQGPWATGHAAAPVMPLPSHGRAPAAGPVEAPCGHTSAHRYGPALPTLHAGAVQPGPPPFCRHINGCFPTPEAAAWGEVGAAASDVCGLGAGGLVTEPVRRGSSPMYRSDSGGGLPGTGQVGASPAPAAAAEHAARRAPLHAWGVGAVAGVAEQHGREARVQQPQPQSWCELAGRVVQERRGSSSGGWHSPLLSGSGAAPGLLLPYLSRLTAAGAAPWPCDPAPARIAHCDLLTGHVTAAPTAHPTRQQLPRLASSSVALSSQGGSAAAALAGTPAAWLRACPPPPPLPPLRRSASVQLLHAALELTPEDLAGLTGGAAGTPSGADTEPRPRSSSHSGGAEALPAGLPARQPPLREAPRDRGQPGSWAAGDPYNAAMMPLYPGEVLAAECAGVHVGVDVGPQHLAVAPRQLHARRAAAWVGHPALLTPMRVYGAPQQPVDRGHSPQPEQERQQQQEA